jgi:hypothetical protein
MHRHHAGGDETVPEYLGLLVSRALVVRPS